MDGQTPQPNIMPGQPQASPPPAPNPESGGMKVIQPLSGDISAASAAQQAPVQPPTYDAPVQSPQNLAALGATSPLQPRPNPHSIYPNLTQDVSPSLNQPATYAADTANVTEQPVVPTGNRAKIIVAIVMAIGAFIVVAAALSLITWIRILMQPGTSSGTNFLGPILAGGQVLLGLGILMRRELARQIYVILAVISLVFSVFGTYQYYQVRHQLSQQQEAAITQTQRSIEQYQHNPYLSASQKAGVIDSLQASVKQQQDQLAKTKNMLLPIIEGYALAIVPLIFLTRPGVKTIFPTLPRG